MLFKKLLARKDKLLKESVALFFSLVMMFFLLLEGSPISIWCKGESQTDQSVFKTVSMLIRKGYVPYKDTFDHKGPIIYIINLLGDYISTYRGIWIVELVFLSLTFFFLYKLARLRCGVFMAIASLMYAYTNLSYYYGTGNLVEEYALLFIAISLFIFCDYFFNDKITVFRLILIGWCFGVVLLLRENMISVWIVFCVAVAIKKCKDKQYADIAKYLGWFVLGAMAIIAPICLWLGFNGALSEFWNQYVLFNFEYSSSSFREKWVLFFCFSNNVGVIFSLFCSIYLIKKSERLFWISYIVFIVTNMYFISISGRIYTHYNLLTIPMIVFPIACVFGEIEKIASKYRVIGFCVVAYMVINSSVPIVMHNIEWAGNVYEYKNEDQVSENVKIACDVVERYTEEDEPIIVFGNWNIIYIKSNRIPASKYSYQDPVIEISDKIHDEFWMEMNTNKPKCVVVQAGKINTEMQEFLKENNYQLIVAMDDYAGVYVREVDV